MYTPRLHADIPSPSALHPPLCWARKYGILVNFDLHTAPGSQMAITASASSFEFISQYTDLIPMFGIVNEDPTSPASDVLPPPHNMMRGITTCSTGTGPFVSIHDSFQDTTLWAGFVPSLEYIILDTYPHFVYDGAADDSPIAMSTDALEGGRDMAEAGVQLLSVVVEYKNAREWNDTTKAAVKQFTLTSMDAMLSLLLDVEGASLR
ncbi:hypothetical protein B0H16DRAFT_1734143 [Mycena metata]|uniref:Uncharacterized protein n=1 Tax=Mycena metata TaxID=1033252 RepID=A0AAD7MRA5_9AGAR|nr:hypothetical protein B0H16DRAFT_1734143 [Mycena metata]